MFDINLGMVELFMFGAFILGSYIKNKLDNRIKTKNIQDLLQCSVHLGITLYTIYNISAMKMHQLHEQIGGKLIGVFTDTIVVEGDINKIECNKHIIGGIRETDIKESI